MTIIANVGRKPAFTALQCGLVAMSRDEVSPALAELIDQHCAAHAALAAVLPLSDAAALGREPSADEADFVGRAEAHEAATLLAICSWRSRSRGDTALRAVYLLPHILNGEIEDGCRDALLASISTSVP